MKELVEIKKQIESWSGFVIEGETKQELKNSISDIAYKLECEISDKARRFRSLIDKLEIEEGV